MHETGRGTGAAHGAFFDRDLVKGVMTGWLEFFESFARGEEPAVVFVPIGQGSGFCAAASARAHSGARSALRWRRLRPRHHLPRLVSCAPDRRIAGERPLADGMAAGSPMRKRSRSCCVKPKTSWQSPTKRWPLRCARCSRIPTTWRKARRAGLAAATLQRERWKGRTVGVALTGGNVDSCGVFAGAAPA